MDQLYPYFDPAVRPQPAAKNGHSRNMLLYMMMAHNAAPPSPGEAVYVPCYPCQLYGNADEG